MRAAQAAGLGDTAFQARLREVQELLQRAVTPELAARVRELQEALARLDPEATRRALERLAEAQQQLKAELERSEELFRRAAIEGALASLAADAEDLRRRQTEWNREDAPRPDSAGAGRQRALADRADSLARGIDRVAQDLRAAPRTGRAAPSQAARAARAAMQRAAQAADQSRAPAAAEAGTEAEQRLAGVPEALRGQRDSLARQWRGETLAALDRALSETAALAQGQEGVAEALRRSEAGAAPPAPAAGGGGGAGAAGRPSREADQGGLRGRAGALSPLRGGGGGEMLQHPRPPAARQRALAEQLERLQAGGASAAAGPLAQEAKELARQLEAGRLDQQTIERQQRLYHRLLDAGRTLSNDEPDETKERVSRSATGDSVHIPDVLKPVAPGLRTSGDRKSTRLNSSHGYISYAVFCLKKKKNKHSETMTARQE